MGSVEAGLVVGSPAARVVTAVAGAPRVGVEVWAGVEMVGAALAGGGAGSGGVVAAARVERML